MPSTAYHKRLNQLENIRSDFESHWQDINDYIAPSRLRLSKDEENDGQKKYNKIVDETAIRARRVLVSGFVSGMTSPARPWLKLVTPDADMMENYAIKLWLEEVERRIFILLARSNFYQVIANIYDDLATFGTASMSALEDINTGVWFYHHPVGEFYISTNDRMIVDTMYRRTTKKVGEIVRLYGEDNVSQNVRNLFKNDQLETRIELVQGIEPNDDRVPGRNDFLNMPYRSVWFEKGGEQQKYLGKRGFMEFPSMCPRWSATAMDDYGVDCPGMIALGGVKQLQFQQKRKAQAIDKMVNPPLQAPSSIKASGPLSVLPGDVNYYDITNGQQGIRPLYELQPRLIEMNQDIAEVQRRINETYFVDMFLMISQQDDVRTATEVALRNEEKLLVLGPALQRVQTELLDPCIDRVFSIMSRNGMLPEAPSDLEGIDLRVEYISMLAQAQQSVGASSIERLINAAGGMAAMNPDVIDKVNYDEALDEYAQILGVPSRVIRPDEEVAQMRSARAQAAQQAQAMEMAAQGAQAAKTASEINVSEDSAIQRLTSGI